MNKKRWKQKSKASVNREGSITTRKKGQVLESQVPFVRNLKVRREKNPQNDHRRGGQTAIEGKRKGDLAELVRIGGSAAYGAELGGKKNCT